MKNIKISDATISFKENTFSFKETLEIARKLSMLNVDILQLREIENDRTDILCIKTICSFVKNSIISVAASSVASVEKAAAALKDAKNKRIKIELPVSTVGMEYTCHKKPEKMLGVIEEIILAAKKDFDDIEFCAVDATRADKDFLFSVIDTVEKFGATSITICDNFAEMMPGEFALFVGEIKAKTNLSVGVFCEDKNGFAVAKSIMAVKQGADMVTTCVKGNAISLYTFAEMVKNSGNRNGYSSNIKYTQLSRIINQINWVTDNRGSSLNTSAATEENAIALDINDDEAAVKKAVALLGYDLTEEDNLKVYEEFKRTAEKKNIGTKELEAIVASVALQVPATYKLENYVINSGNIISSSAQITLTKDGKELSAVEMGDGPIDAAFKAIDKILGTHYELDDFQIQAITEGKGAMGSAIIKLRNEGKLYSGQGISTDIIAAGIRAYINAVNKIVYEEA